MSVKEKKKELVFDDIKLLIYPNFQRRVVHNPLIHAGPWITSGAVCRVAKVFALRPCVPGDGKRSGGPIL